MAKRGGRGDDWAAYIGPVPGYSHMNEYQQVLDTGTKLPKAIAELLSPRWAEQLQWRP